MKLTQKQKDCKHENIIGTETYTVYGEYDKDDKKIYLKQGDGGLNNDLECEDCGLIINDTDYELEFV